MLILATKIKINKSGLLDGVQKNKVSQVKINFLQGYITRSRVQGYN